MAKVLVDQDFLEDGLALICDKIRLKTGGTGSLAFPNEIAAAVESIETGSGGITPTGTKEITENTPEGETVDVTSFAAVTVNVPTGITPAGTLSITENTEQGETVDVTEYAAVTVAVPMPAPPAGKLEITANGDDIDVADYAYVKVAVPIPAKIYDVVLLAQTGEFTVYGVQMGSGGVTGYSLYAESSVAAGQQGAIYEAWVNPAVAQNEVGRKYYYNGEIRVNETPVGGAPIVYDSTAHTLKIRVAGNISVQLKPGNYKLVVW